ncbi:hypothetical protein OKW50_008057 [Paraburkholderia youngii]|uniref:methyltransferase domain-containing protein n=1 Tax=Paraburkholderia youngii TaxID=2782701 RepID=UPI003D1D3EFA
MSRDTNLRTSKISAENVSGKLPSGMLPSDTRPPPSHREQTVRAIVAFNQLAKRHRWIHCAAAPSASELSGFPLVLLRDYLRACFGLFGDRGPGSASAVDPSVAGPLKQACEQDADAGVTLAQLIYVMIKGKDAFVGDGQFDDKGLVAYLRSHLEAHEMSAVIAAVTRYNNRATEPGLKLCADEPDSARLAVLCRDEILTVDLLRLGTSETVQGVGAAEETQNSGMEASVISDQEYVDALRVMDSSGRGETIINALERNILGELSEEEDFLEVGVGTGIVTNAISKNFKRTSIVEINPDLMTHINFLPEMVFHESVVNVKLPVGRYDLVLCSHVFYRFSIEEITQAVLRLRAGLKHTGVLAIVMTAPRNTYHELCSFFDINYTNSGHIHKVLNDLGVSYKSISKADRYICERREEFSALCRFFIAMDCDPAQTGSVRRLDGNQFLEDFLLRSKKDKGYEIVVEHDLLWLTGAD